MDRAGRFGKVIQLGEQPVRLELDAYYNATRPQVGNDTWLPQATVTFIILEPRVACRCPGKMASGIRLRALSAPGPKADIFRFCASWLQN